MLSYIKKKASELGTKGVAIIYWNNGRFCTTYETDGCFYLNYRTKEELIIDYIGKGWDGSYLSHGSACHENDYFRQVVNQVIIPMYDSKDLQRHYKEYIPIAQIENGKVLVPEVILPERLKYKEKGVESEGR